MVKMLKPKVQTLSHAVVKRSVGSLTIAATPRTRGRKWMERRAAWLREHPMCVMCEMQGFVTAAEEVDHIVPLWDGGADDESNYQSLCKPCHSDKTAREAGHRAKR